LVAVGGRLLAVEDVLKELSDLTKSITKLFVNEIGYSFSLLQGSS
jgi:hypothetical protein